ncbi:hypothetical protein UFOVP27_96 [uncultured Caudovirales phage]|uniref:Uncharacterized protein n=1 Tax=uncultured Caudovirales phage TaxID=2100421 RepID=A0A6J5KM22_9CAUD|nr:hypothetical protein UFOVP27_96 [uncultured Caudovirales phage]
MPKSKVRPKAVEKKKAAAKFKADGKTHIVDKHGTDVKVHHPGGGKTMNLTKLAGAVTIGAGVTATKKYHSKKGSGE